MLLKDYKLISPTIQNDIKAALAKHGLDIVKWSVGVEETMGEISFKIVARDTSMTVTPEEVRWNLHAPLYATLYGLNPEWLNKTIVGGGGSPAKILGLLNTRSEKCVSLLVGGKKMVCTIEALRRMAKQSGLAPPPDFKLVEGDIAH